MSSPAVPQAGHTPSGHSRRLLAVVAADTMAWVILRPWLTALAQDGWEVHLACPAGKNCEALSRAGFRVHLVALKRNFNGFAHIRACRQLYRVLKANKIEVMNAHGPVAGAVGRVAAYRSEERRVGKECRSR